MDSTAKLNVLNYSPREGTADFVVKNRQTTYVIEVGYGKKSWRQIEATMRVPNNRIGILLANDKLALNEDKNIVVIPIREFLLI